MHTLMHLDILHHVDALTWWEFFIEILDYAVCQATGKGSCLRKAWNFPFCGWQNRGKREKFFCVVSVLLLAQDTLWEPQHCRFWSQSLKMRLEGISAYQCISALEESEKFPAMLIDMAWQCFRFFVLVTYLGWNMIKDTNVTLLMLVAHDGEVVVQKWGSTQQKRCLA